MKPKRPIPSALSCSETGGWGPAPGPMHLTPHAVPFPDSQSAFWPLPRFPGPGCSGGLKSQAAWCSSHLFRTIYLPRESHRGDPFGFPFAKEVGGALTHTASPRGLQDSPWLQTGARAWPCWASDLCSGGPLLLTETVAGGHSAPASFLFPSLMRASSACLLCF